MEARSSQDLACCAMATARARSKSVSAFAASGSGNINAISPAVRWISASYHFSWVDTAAVMASPRQRQAQSNCPSSAWALAKHDRYHGIHNVAPVDRHAVIPELSIWTAFEASPVRVDSQPWL